MCEKIVYTGVYMYLAMAAVSLTYGVSGYKPVVFMHGVLAGKSEADQIVSWINRSHPGTRLYVIDMYDNTSSLTALSTQIPVIGKKLEQVTKKEKHGFHLIGYSQGGLISRGLLQQFSLNVDTFISLSAPIAGVFGRSILRGFLPKFAPKLFYLFAYTNCGQDISVCNYWNDPYHQDQYKKHSQFLAIFNNDTCNPKSQEFRSNFLRLKKLVLIGGPDDEVIDPWQSSQFGFYDVDNDMVVSMHKQKFYTEDSFGLRTLDQRGAIHTYTMPGVKHEQWCQNPIVFEKFILPHLT